MRYLTLLAALLCGVEANRPTANPSPRPTAPTALPTEGPTNPTHRPTNLPTFQQSFTCDYPSAGISGSNYGSKNIYMCPTTIYACRGDTFTIGNCDAADPDGSDNSDMCYGDQYIIVQAYPYGDAKTVAFNDNCQYNIAKGAIRESKCSSVTYTVPTTDTVQCRVYGVILACGKGTCGGKNIPIYMPGNPTLAPVEVPSPKPTRVYKKASLFGVAGADEGIIFAIVVGCLIVIGLIFVACLRLNPRFNHWFWSLEFISNRFLGVTPPTAKGAPRKSNMELWGFDDGDDGISLTQSAAAAGATDQERAWQNSRSYTKVPPFSTAGRDAGRDAYRL